MAPSVIYIEAVTMIVVMEWQPCMLVKLCGEIGLRL